MREALKKLGGDSLIYGLGSVGGRAVQLILLPILTRALKPDAFGVGELVMAYSQTLLLVLVIGMDGALARFFYQEPDREARIRMASSSLAFRMTLGFAVAAGVALASGPLAEAFMGGEVYRKYLLTGALTLPFSLLVLFGNDVLRVTFQPAKFITLNITNTVVIGVLSVWFVVGMNAGVIGMLYGKLGGDALCALLALVLVRHSIRPRFSREALGRMLGYGAPSVPAAFAFGTISAMDRYFLQRLRSLEEVGVYAVALKFFTVVSIGVSGFQLAYGPFAFARAQHPDSPRLFARVFGAYVGLASLGALLVGLFAPEVVAILVPVEYRGAAGPALWLAFAAVALGAYTVASVGVGIALRTPLLVWCAAGAALTALGANLLLIPRYGIMGAGAATCLGYVMAATLTYIVSQRVQPMPYRGARMAAVFVAGLALGLVVQRWAPAGAAGVAIKLGAAGVFALALTSIGMWKDRGAVARAIRTA
jgi:O-antigen/teichoic acid export membrane protein